jgi:hypothetical protein
MEVKEMVRLQLIDMKIDINIEVYKASINRLKGENDLYTEKEFPDLVSINNKWIAKYEDRIELLTDLKK